MSFNHIISLCLLFCVVTAAPALAEKPSKKKKESVFTLSTNLGEIVFLLSDKTPLHKENFTKLTKDGFYDGTTFHRVIKDFMIQGGDPNTKDQDPNNDGQGGPGYTVPAEFDSSLTHVLGAVAAARMGDGVNPKKESSGSQFYIVSNDRGTPFLNNNYTVFGQVIKGIDVVKEIANQPKDGRDRPLKDIPMKVTVKVLKAKKIKKLYDYDINAWNASS